MAKGLSVTRSNSHDSSQSEGKDNDSKYNNRPGYCMLTIRTQKEALALLPVITTLKANFKEV